MPVLLIPGLEALAGALMGFLGWLGGKVIGKLIGTMVGSITGSFGPVKAITSSIIDDAIDGLASFFDSYLAPMITFVMTPVTWVRSVFAAVTSLGSSTYHGFFNIMTSVLPGAIANAEGFAAKGVLAAEAYADKKVAGFAATLTADVAHVEDYAHNLFSAVSADVVADLGKAEDFTRAMVGSVLATVASDLSKAESYALSTATGLFRTAESDIVGLGTKVAAEVAGLGKTLAGDVLDLEKQIVAAESAAVAGVLGAISTDVEKVVGKSEAAVAAAVAGVIDVAGDGFADILDWIKDIDLTKITDIAGVTALSVTIAGALSQYLRECGMPNCRNLSSLGRDLQALLGLVDDAAMLALFVELASNPEGGAHLVMNIFGPIADGATSAAKSLLGV